ncbi:MAG TPA: Smr/MutS family protein [Chitinophagales bacterium]|nr:Smr/MutS family protein [Chitinophagales bacterium]HNA57540.1 Smr/MutS family protein [Chitinophagales bacterium]HNE44791.1 Smr/MutS family protein [Chitinophagales bacterium]HNF68155.1 Smr/MutS family protein [Chitinophagales bacterium]HNI54887.1 Smr/MutS family protein [Chitinophagales bacterium]
MRIFPADIPQVLEFEKVLHEVARYCDSSPGADRVARVRPLDKFDEVKKMLLQTREMTHLLQYAQGFPHDKMFDIRPTLPLLAIENYVLSEQQCHEIHRVALLMGSIIRFFNSNQEQYPVLQQFVSGTTYVSAISQSIKAVIDDAGHMRNDASPELVRILKEKDDAMRSLGKVFQSALQKYRSAGFLSEVEESMRNGRRVLGIQSEYKRKIAGIIHDESETGRTVFMEPQEVVNIQNEIFELEREEKREIYRILKTLTADLAPHQQILDKYQQILGIIDFTRAKGRYALETQSSMPQLEKQPIVCLYDARHPVLLSLHKKQHKQVVPLQAELDSNNRILVISGPNAGGKSVAMKTIGLLQYMTQCGLLIPASSHSRIGIFKQIFCDIGDTQSLEDELSTYSARLMKIRHFLQHADRETLLLIDEFGSGTDPVMGGAIAEAALRMLNEKKIFGVITTHYANLKSFAANAIGLFNGSMLYDEAELKPMYLLETGKPGSSYAFELAKKSALPGTLIEEAKKLISKEHIRFEELLKNVRIEKEHIRLRDKEVSKKEEQLKKKEVELAAAMEKTREQREKYNLKKLEKEDQTIREMEATFKNLLQEFKQVQSDPEMDNATKEQSKDTVRKFFQEQRKKTFDHQKKIRPTPIPQWQRGEIKIGGYVKLNSGSEIGVLESVKNNKATVIFNNIRTTVPYADLIGIAKTEAPAITPAKIKVTIDESDFNTELDLRGQPREEAMMNLEQYLDAAMMRKIYQLRILHGKGTGAIREVVQQTLKSHPAVLRFEFANREGGGDGVTLVTLG